MKILANDGISQSGINLLTDNKFEVITDTVDQDKLIEYINKNGISVLLVRSATKVRKDIIDGCKSLKIIGRGGVGMDNIDVEYARSKGLLVINTPSASSTSVAELVFSHLYSCVRFLHDSNRNMPLSGEKDFKKLKKNYSAGVELKNKILGIVGFGRIGQEVAKIALGVGMKILVYDKYIKESNIVLEIADSKIKLRIDTVPIEDLLRKSDFITLHVPAQKEYVIGKKEFQIMKNNSAIINASRGGVIDEVELTKNLNSGKLLFAGLDTFENEPNPSIQILMNPKISLSPHIGAATNEAQDRIGSELANQIIDFFNS